MSISPDEQYHANLTLLLQQPGTEGLVQQLRNTVLTNLVMEVNPQGHVVGMIWDPEHQTYIPLCELQEPLVAAERAMESLWSRETTIFTMLGIGLGYAVVALARKLLPYQRLVVWDPEPIFLKAGLHCFDLREFSGKRVEIYVGNDVPLRLEPWYLSLHAEEKLHLGFPIHHGYTGIQAPPEQPGYRKADYAAIHGQIIDLMRFHMVGLATWRQFGRHIGDNDIANMPEYFINPGFARLKGLWQGKPAVCVAAGPSLHRNLRLLLPAVERQKVALITAGTTYALVQGLGLQPEIATTIDFQELNWTDQFRYVPLDPACSLVYLHSTWPQTPRRWAGPVFVAENSSDTIGWIRQFAGEEKGDASQVQTVAHLNVLVALMLGANPIILLGQDLSMPPDMHHATGGRAQDAAPNEAGADAFMDVPDMYGRPVKTRHSFQSMRIVFERIFASHPETTFINASEQGILLRGARHQSFAETLASLPSPEASSLPERPAFQGESLALLATRAVSPLRAQLAETFASYVPATLATLPEAFTGLCTQVEALGTWARETVTAWEAIETGKATGLDFSHAFWAAVDASEIVTHAETIEQVWALPQYQRIIATEAILGQYPHATGMFVIRRFDFIELRGAIPPPIEELREPWQQARYAASRLAQAAQMFLDELPTIQRLLRRTQQRMQPFSTVVTSLVRQHYRQARTLLEAHRQTIPLEHTTCLGRLDAQRLWAEFFRQTQQYAAALAFLSPTSRHAQRIQQHLARYHADVRHAMPTYFQPVSPVTPDVSRTHWDVMAVSLAALPSVTKMFPLSEGLLSLAEAARNGYVLSLFSAPSSAPVPMIPVPIGA